MSLGSTLRAAREACGMTTSELAARTHMLVQIVEGIENEDFRRIPAPIYGRGFIKLYCEAVKIDPKPLQAEFMELYNKAKDAPAKVEPPPMQRHQPPVPPPTPSQEEVQAPVTEPEAAAEPLETSTEPAPQPMAELGDLFAQPVEPPRPAAQPVQSMPITESAPPKRSYGELFGETYATKEEAPRTSAAEKFRNTMSNVSSGVFANVQHLPPNTGRIVAVSICAIIVFSLIGWGVFALYKATTPVDEQPTVQTKTVKTNVANVEKPKAAPKTTKVEAKNAQEVAKKPLSAKPGELKSSGIDIPALYID